MTQQFAHDHLRVYRDAIAFVAWCQDLLTRCADKAIQDQLDRASAGIALNIAEGNGKRSIRERRRFFEIARGSALECAACLDVLVAKKRIGAVDAETGKEQLRGIVSMLFGLTREKGRR